MNKMKLLMFYRKNMKSLFIIPMILGSFFSLMGQNYEPKVKVKSMIILDEKHDMLFTKTVKDYEAYYDNHGNVIEEINYKQGKISKHFKYYYDSDNNN